MITGSSGKTTLLHLIESQLGEKAKYSHEANSSFGVPFDILGIYRKDLTLLEWPMIFLLAPLGIFRKLPQQKIYVVEADCDRPHEGKFLAEFLNPEVTLWVSSTKTHCMNFDHLVKAGKFKTVEEAIAFEFGNYIEKTEKLVIANGDSRLIGNQLKRAKCKIVKVSQKCLEKYKVSLGKTIFQISGVTYEFGYLLPKETNISIQMCLAFLKYLGVKAGENFSRFKLPPGRSSVFKGIKGVTIVDSSYNANYDSMKAIIEMYSSFETKKKWVVLGDMLEQGNEEKEEHERLAKLISRCNFDKVILMGPRVIKFTKPLLPGGTVSFVNPKDVLNYLKRHISDNEVILFKGARFLEGVIAQLLKDPRDIQKLARRQKIWEKRRKKWGV